MPRRWYRWYVLGVLTAVYTLNYVDQGLMGLLLQPIKVDLHLSDNQLGFLTGIAFALFYATLGLPRGSIGRRSAPQQDDSRRSLAEEGAADRKAPPSTTASLTDVASTLWHQQSARHLIIGLVLLLIMASGIGAWNAAFMMRCYGMKTGELGLWLGLIFGIGGMLGTLLGGYVCGRWFPGNECGQVRASAIVIASLVPLYFVFLLTSQRNIALAVLVPMSMASNFFVGPTFALLQRLVPNEARATTLAIVMLLGNLIGMGIGPQLVGVASDLLYHSLGEDSLRYALLAMSFVAWATAYYFWRTGFFVERDLISGAASQRSDATNSPCHA